MEVAVSSKILSQIQSTQHHIQKCTVVFTRSIHVCVCVCVCVVIYFVYQYVNKNSVSEGYILQFLNIFYNFWGSMESYLLWILCLDSVSVTGFYILLLPKCKVLKCSLAPHPATNVNNSWFQTFTKFSMLYAFFWVIPRRLNFICRRFGTLCVFHLHRQVGMKYTSYLPTYEYGTDRVFWKVGI